MFPWHTGRVIERATILLLASVVSLCATQPLPARTARSSEVPAIIQLAESRCNQTISIKTEVAQPASGSPARALPAQASFLVPQNCSEVTVPRTSWTYLTTDLHFGAHSERILRAMVKKMKKSAL
jgi:hypothetical protein